MNEAPIGVFDSGVGGITVARALLDQLPGEQIYYIGDTAHSPYGSKPLSQVKELAIAVMDQLVEEGVKLLVIACNTATAAVITEARERYTKKIGLPVIEVIKPAARAAMAATRNGRVGVIGTQATIESGAYEEALGEKSGLKIFTQACPRFVEIVEAGITSGEEVLSVAEEYLLPIQRSGVDTLVLGCTHYPLLTGAISYVMGADVTLVSSAEETAKDVYRSLTSNNLLRSIDLAENITHTFAATGDPQAFERLATRFLGPIIGHVVSAKELAV